eukprot:gnl/Chilomastix_cuspidata/5700.p1 GENE.gnl/Chilomastix_cuspidata/5700~~gnl/Chilomastix_cuspidata/5700.p1  ORF type:complete len:720 (+),score=375.62 gnl/Chilomastix_cuspidata/5700:52-2211(+)
MSLDAYIRELYEAKCKDLLLSPNETQFQRFAQGFKEKNETDGVQIVNQGIGFYSSRVVAKMVRDLSFTNIILPENPINDDGACEIAKIIPHIPDLHTLDLRSCNIQSRGAVALFRAIGAGSTLRELRFSSESGVNRNYPREKGFAALAACLRSARHLRRLNIGATSLNATTARVLAAGLAENRSLSELALASNGIGCSGLKALGPALVRTPLAALDLSRNRIGDAGVEHFCMYALPRYMHLTALDLSHNCVGPAGGQCLASVLALESKAGFVEKRRRDFEAVEREKAVREHIDGIGAKVRAFVRRAEGEMSGARLGQPGAALDAAHATGAPDDPISPLKIQASSGSLAPDEERTISGYCALETLALAHNPLGESILDVSAALAINRTLKAFDASGCGIGPDGAKALAAALAQNRTLETLRLANNALGDDGGVEVFRALGATDSLRSLDVSSNKLRDRSGAMLLTALHKNPVVRTVTIKDNDFTDETGRGLVAAVKAMENVCALSCDLNRFSHKVFKHIQAAVLTNQLAFRQNTSTRLRARLDTMQELSTQLFFKKSELTKLREERARAERGLLAGAELLEKVEEDTKAERKALTDRLKEHQAVTQALSEESFKLGSQMGSSRAKSEASIRMLNARITREHDAIRSVKQRVPALEATVGEKEAEIKATEVKDKTAYDQALERFEVLSIEYEATKQRLGLYRNITAKRARRPAGSRLGNKY